MTAALRLPDQWAVACDASDGVDKLGPGQALCSSAALACKRGSQAGLVESGDARAAYSISGYEAGAAANALLTVAGHLTDAGEIKRMVRDIIASSLAQLARRPTIGDWACVVVLLCRLVRSDAYLLWREALLAHARSGREQFLNAYPSSQLPRPPLAVPSLLRNSRPRLTTLSGGGRDKIRNVCCRRVSSFSSNVPHDTRRIASGNPTENCSVLNYIGPPAAKFKGRRVPQERRNHPGGLGRDSHRHPSRIARRTSTLARLHQHRREHDGHGAQSLSQRETVAFGLDGAALDRRGDGRSSQGLSQAEGSQATANLASCAHRPSQQDIKQSRSCERSESRVT